MKVLLLLLISINALAHEKMNDQCGEQSAVPKQQRLFNKIKWTTASELNNFGYDVYRAESKEGDYSVINEDMIEGAGTTVDATKYEVHDDTIDPCKRYFYYIESIAEDGTREAFSPRFQSKLKLDPKK